MMHTFFHGWRRKFGMATLAVACALLLTDAMFGPEPWAVHWHQSEPVSHEWSGMVTTSQSSVGTVAVPNWAMAIPLTLLSAYLILWKPRKRVNSDA
ncbi:MAG: hypothetical protein JWP89_1710 [Schlesneria sp.]|nr:hypothetical protein [Schlesneria sp.]